MSLDKQLQERGVINPRIYMIDALRGFALAAILLHHHIQHFNFMNKPIFTPDWLLPIDQWLFDASYLFFSGKAFALFSLLFGFSYWIIYENARKRGESYLFRHFWRMALLIGFGLLHMLFFYGDILIMYAVLGLPLVFTRYMNNKMILFIAVVLLANPVNLYSLGSYFLTANIYDFQLPWPKGDNTWKLLAGDSFFALMQSHFSHAFQGAMVWAWNVGRIMLIPGLFLLGVYFAKTKSLTERPLPFWYSLLVISLVSWFLFELAYDAGVLNIADKSTQKILELITLRYTKLVMMLSILATFVIVWRHNDGNVFVARFIDFGRMGLTNYLLMSVIGSFLYYGWGLALYQYCGSTVTLFIGLSVLILQMKFSSYWLARYDQGPLEKLWRTATWWPSRAFAQRLAVGLKVKKPLATNE